LGFLSSKGIRSRAEYRVEKLAAILRPRLETLRSVVCANLARKEAVAAA